MGETFRCTKIRHQEAAYLYSVELRGFSELGRGPWHLRLSCEKICRELWPCHLGRFSQLPKPEEWADGDYSLGHRHAHTSGIRPRPLDVGNLNRGLCAWWVWRIGYEKMWPRGCTYASVSVCISARMLAQTCEPVEPFRGGGGWWWCAMYVCGQGGQYLELGSICEEGIDGPAQPQSAMIANQCRPGQKGKRGQIRHRLVRGCEWREGSHTPREERDQAFHHEGTTTRDLWWWRMYCAVQDSTVHTDPRQTPGC
jgi:hypothetical protein